MKMIRLNEVAFYGELPALLGVSKSYVKGLTKPVNDWHKDQEFPQPFFVSASGVRVWFVRDVEDWCSKIRLKRTKRRLSSIGSTLLDRTEIADQILGRRS